MVGVVIDYTDTTITAWTLTANFEGFSHSLKEQSGKIKCVYIPNNSNLKI